MKDKTIYRIVADGNVLTMDYESYDKAMDGIRNLFAENAEMMEARIIKCTFKDLGVRVLNNKKQ